MIRWIAAGFAALASCSVAFADTVTYFPVTSGAHPHDVAAAPDGTVWYTAQRQGALGILDPKTGKVDQLSLGKGAAPHGVIAGPDGAAWITESGLNAIARVEPKSRDVKLFPLPKGFEKANLNTATFDKNGTLWFTGQSGVYGKLDPASGRLDAWKAPKGAGPYGITTTPSGEVWYASLAGDHIARVDTASGAATVVDPPKPGVGPRRIWSDSKGMLWVSFWFSGEIGRYDPAQNVWKVFALPKSKSGCFSVYVDEKDKVWVTDFIANAILRFDPATEKFDTFQSNKRGAAVRQMLGCAGEVWGLDAYIDRIISASSRATSLINDVLSYSRLSSENLVEEIDLNNIVGEILQDLELVIGEKNARIQVGHLPVIQAVSGQMRQLFQNIIANSLKFHKPGQSPVVYITSKPVENTDYPEMKDAAGQLYEIRVKDEGIGFEDQYARKIFSLFQRLNSKEKYEGTGIGLAIANKIVERHHGLIIAKGTKHDGAEFIIVLPEMQPIVHSDEEGQAKNELIIK